MKLIILFICVLICSPFHGFSQENYIPYTLEIKTLDSAEIDLGKLIDYKKSFEGKGNLRIELNNILHTLHGEGYLSANLDSLSIDTARLLAIAWLYVGNQFTWSHLRKGNLDNYYLAQSGFKEKFYFNKPFHYEELRQLQGKILDIAENSGHPFTTIKIDSLEISGSEISGALMFEKHQLITIDTLVINGNAKLSNRFMMSYLGLRKNDVYKEKIIREIRKRINELPYVTQTKAFTVTFIRDKARIDLFLEAKNASRFNFLIGILPNSPSKDGKLLITGEANMNLVNPFGSGKAILFTWRGLQPQSPELDLRFIAPYLFGSPIGLDVRANLYKRDTSFLDLIGELGIQYILIGRNYLKAFYYTKSSSSITVDTAEIISSKSLPPYLDSRNSQYGLGYHFEKLDYRINPRKGYSISLQGSVGKKVIKKNSLITSIQDSTFDYETLYDSLELSNVTAKLDLGLNAYIPISRYFILTSSLTIGALVDDALFVNDLYRIGGNNLLRGFDEESIFASSYSVFTIEPRYLIGQNSFFHLFIDLGYIRRDLADPTPELDPEDFAVGFGGGLALETKAGIFGVSYALGRLNADNPLQFKNGKIHLGYLSYF